MVRLNLIEPQLLADQHLIAEYREILLLFGYYRKHPKINPSDNHLQPMKFYQDKIIYLIKRFFDLKEEMIRRSFKPTKDIIYCRHTMCNGRLKDFKSNKNQIQQMGERIIQRVNERLSWYRYCGEVQPPEFFESLINNHTLLQKFNDFKYKHI